MGCEPTIDFGTKIQIFDKHTNKFDEKCNKSD